MFKKVGMVRSCIQNWSLIYQYKIHQMHIDVYVNQLFAAQIKVNFWVMEMRPSNSHSSNLAFPYKCARHWSRGCIVLNMYKYTWVHMMGIDLDLVVLHIHMIYML